MGRPWYAFYPESYGRDTAHLTFVQDAAYRRLLDHYYSTEKPLPVELASIWRITGASDNTERKAVSSILAEFFHLEGDGYHNWRADEELAARDKIIADKRASGRIGGNAAKGKSGRPKNSRRNSSAITDAITPAIVSEYQNNTQTQTQLHSVSNETEIPVLRTSASGEATTAPKRNSLNGSASNFEAFYAAYPLRVKRRAAEKAYISALKRAPPDVILAGAKRYRDDPKRQSKPEFTSHPASWLNADCWLDETDGPPAEDATDRALRKLQEFRENGSENRGR